MKNIFISDPNIIKSLLLLILAIFGNFLTPILSCSTQQHLLNNMFIKHFILICVIYFTLSFSDDDVANPIIHMKNTAYIYIYFLLFTRQNIIFISLSLLLLLLIHILDDYIAYYKSINIDNSKIKLIETFRKNIFLTLSIIMIIGCGIYLSEQYLQYKTKFNLQKFIAGTTKC